MPAGMAVAGVGGRHRVERIYEIALFFVLLRLSLSPPGRSQL
jgi:hypothetical protein